MKTIKEMTVDELVDSTKKSIDSYRVALAWGGGGQ